MKEIRKIVKDLVDEIPEDNLKDALVTLEKLIEKDFNESWLIWEEFGKDAVEGKWEDASERHDFYLYGLNR